MIAKERYHPAPRYSHYTNCLACSRSRRNCASAHRRNVYGSIYHLYTYVEVSSTITKGRLCYKQHNQFRSKLSEASSRWNTRVYIQAAGPNFFYNIIWEYNRLSSSQQSVNRNNCAQWKGGNAKRLRRKLVAYSPTANHFVLFHIWLGNFLLFLFIFCFITVEYKPSKRQHAKRSLCGL